MIHRERLTGTPARGSGPGGRWLSARWMPKINQERERETACKIQSVHIIKRPFSLPALLDCSLSLPGFKMHLFGVEARGMSPVGFRRLQLSKRRAPEGGRDRRQEARKGGEEGSRERGGGRPVKAVAGRRSPAAS